MESKKKNKSQKLLIFRFYYKALRVAFIDEVETLTTSKVHIEFFSKLVKGDINGKTRYPYLRVAFIDEVEETSNEKTKRRWTKFLIIRFL
ncbi:hypothetical protein L2E82_19626 [Cichorium intybus]|uniref:Uncharacterized protein n=1 Tax=Cichorium intybus TaxID=13427 RepID=A0ACB9FDT2_CICIN|nr:hypothetical protein L2E82_19626 [Cichorium intybus]